MALDVIDVDLTRLSNVCKFDFGNGANRSISLDFSIVSTQLTKAAWPFFSAVSRSYAMLSVAFNGYVHACLHVVSSFSCVVALASL